MTTDPQVSLATTSYHPPTTRRQREAVLIVAYGDGRLDAFADSHVDIRIEISPYMESPEGEALAEEFVELSLPWQYRQLFWPGKLRAMGMVRKIRPSEIAQREWELEMLQTLDRVASYGREGRKIWTS